MRRSLLAALLLLVVPFPALAQGVTLPPPGSSNAPGLKLSYQTVPLTGAAFIPDVNGGANMILNLVHGTCPCTLNNMGNLSAGQFGTVQVVNSSTGNEVITLSGSQYGLTVTPPYVVDGSSHNDWLYYVNAQGFVQFYQTIMPPSLSSTVPSQITGGDGMTSGWVQTRTTLAPGAACTDPAGGTNTCALLTEDGSSNTHFVNQTTTMSAGPITVSVFAKINSGTRFVEMRIADGPFSNVVSYTFDPAACGNIGSGLGATPAPIGTAVFSAAGTIVRPNGWCEGWFQGSLGSAVPVFMNIQLSTSSGDFYLGTGQSNLLWRPAVRSGALSPP